MQHPQLQAHGLTFSIIAEQTAEGWRAVVLIPSTQHDGQLCWSCLISAPIPGLYECAADAYQVAHLFAVVNASGDRPALAELDWRYRAGLVSTPAHRHRAHPDWHAVEHEGLADCGQQQGTAQAAAEVEMEEFFLKYGASQ